MIFWDFFYIFVDILHNMFYLLIFLLIFLNFIFYFWHFFKFFSSYFLDFFFLIFRFLDFLGFFGIVLDLLDSCQSYWGYYWELPILLLNSKNGFNWALLEEISLRPEVSSSPCFRIQGWGGVPWALRSKDEQEIYFWICWIFFGFFCVFFSSFLDLFGFFEICWIFSFFFFLVFFWIPFKVTNVTSKSYQENYWTQNNSQNWAKTA